MPTKSKRTTKQHGYAIVDSRGTVQSLFKNARDAEGKWGYNLELVRLKREHVLGEQIDYDEHGVET